MDPGALDQYVKLTEPIPGDLTAKLPAKGKESTRMLPASLAQEIVKISTSQQHKVLAENLNRVDLCTKDGIAKAY